jgi:uncharacterized Zn finger protein
MDYEFYCEECGMHKMHEMTSVNYDSIQFRCAGCGTVYTYDRDG